MPPPRKVRSKSPTLRPNPQILQPSIDQNGIQHFTSQSYSGPIPPPQFAQGWEQVSAGSTNRILSLAEREAAHRQHIELISTTANIEAQARQLDMQQHKLKTDSYRATLGQWSGTIVSIICVAGGVYLGMNDKTVIGAALVGLPLIGLVKTLIGRKDPPTSSR